MATHRYCPLCARELVETPVEGLLRRTCSDIACGYVFWDNPLPVVAGIVEYDGTVLLARNQAWPEGTFGLITGFVERGEDPRDAVAREIREEVDLQAEQITLVGAYGFPRKNELIIAYHVVASGTIRLNHELAELKPVPIPELQGWSSATGLAVTDWLRSRQSR